MAQWQSCCRGRRSNCPQLLVNGRVIHIRDDDGNQITLTIDQFQDVHLKLNEIITQRGPVPAPLGLVP